MLTGVPPRPQRLEARLGIGHVDCDFVGGEGGAQHVEAVAHPALGVVERFGLIGHSACPPPRLRAPAHQRPVQRERFSAW